MGVGKVGNILDSTEMGKEESSSVHCPSSEVSPTADHLAYSVQRGKCKAGSIARQTAYQEMKSIGLKLSVTVDH